jgi:hypothetical protein
VSPGSIDDVINDMNDRVRYPVVVLDALALRIFLGLLKHSAPQARRH